MIERQSVQLVSEKQILSPKDQIGRGIAQLVVGGNVWQIGAQRELRDEIMAAIRVTGVTLIGLGVKDITWGVIRIWWDGDQIPTS